VTYLVVGYAIGGALIAAFAAATWRTLRDLERD
jgi:hypothetical protein